MANQNSAKGNPASKRMTNQARKAKRERSWKKRQREKEETKREVKKREDANKATKKAGGLTPHQQNQQDHLRKRQAIQG